MDRPSPSPHIDPHTLRVLEFPVICQMLADRATSALGRERALALTPGTDLAGIDERLRTVSEFRTILQANDTVPIRGIKDIRPALAQARIEGTALDPATLLDVASTLQTSRLLRAFGSQLHEKLPSPRVERLLAGLGTFPGIEEAVSQAIDPSGVVKDQASSTLRRIRREQQTIRERTREHLTGLVQSDTGRQALQEPVVTVREGRYVVPVRIEHRNRIRGVVHDQSASGATLFVEPFAVVELNNRLRELEIEERREIDRILSAITTLIRQEIEQIVETVMGLQQVDFFYAAGRFSLDLRAGRPRLNQDGQIDLRNARHPLLECSLDPAQPLRKAVPLTLRVGGSASTLVITGPNMGGKTVALKTVGLLTLMAQSGLHVPADEPADLAVFTQVFADIGDEQSIQQNLSTFSSHLQQVITILNQADARTLVLLDELGAGTDPTAGAALGMAVLESLTGRRAVTIATTHYGALKEFAARTPGVENGSMEFDVTTLSPTYRFRQGIPGGSYAVEIGRRLGLPDVILDRTIAVIGSDERRLEELIVALDRERRLHEEAREQAERLREELDRLTKDYRDKLDTLTRTERDFLRKAQERADRVLRDANTLVERTVADIRAQQASREAIKQAKTALHEQRAQVRQQLDETRPAPAPEPARSLQVGDEVWVESLRANGVIVEASDGRLRVRVGKVEITVRREDVRAPALSEAEEPVPERRAGGVRVHTPTRVNPELDLRGYTADEAIEAVDRYLYDASMAGLSSVWIIHGKGSGVLRQEIGKFLKAHDLVKSYRLAEWNEGGSGVTVVELG
ncbi:MAG: endonuclease MutS2 [Candidatus Latescibacteria bacterium]|nr:endonuclease MutS2 [Candidatus Latescibacterota bacterium]